MLTPLRFFIYSEPFFAVYSFYKSNTQIKNDCHRFNNGLISYSNVYPVNDLKSNNDELNTLINHYNEESKVNNEMYICNLYMKCGYEVYIYNVFMKFSHEMYI